MAGEITLAFQGLEPAAEPGLTMTVYTAEPGSPFEEGLRPARLLGPDAGDPGALAAQAMTVGAEVTATAVPPRRCRRR